jgi:hypothetical protein
MSQDKEYFFCGIASPYVYDSLEIAYRANIIIAGFIHNKPDIDVPKDLSPVLLLEDLQDLDRNSNIVIPLITPGYRKLIELQLKEKGFSSFPEFIDPTSVIARTAIWGEGFQVNAGVVVASKCSFGRHVQINRSVSIGHDAMIGDYVSFGPGVVLCGSVTIGPGTFVGANATIVPGIIIGKNVVIGAGAVVTNDVADHTVVSGVPARVIRTDSPGYNKVSV